MDSALGFRLFWDGFIKKCVNLQLKLESEEKRITILAIYTSDKMHIIRIKCNFKAWNRSYTL